MNDDEADANGYTDLEDDEDPYVSRAEHVQGGHLDSPVTNLIPRFAQQ